MTAYPSQFSGGGGPVTIGRLGRVASRPVTSSGAARAWLPLTLLLPLTEVRVLPIGDEW